MPGGNPGFLPGFFHVIGNFAEIPYYMKKAFRAGEREKKYKMIGKTAKMY